MQMTTEERQDYDKLTEQQKEEFDYQCRKHPEWSFKQVMAKLAFEEKVDETVGNGGEDVDVNDPVTWVAILEGVKITLSKFVSIGRAIFVTIDSAITSLKGLILAGIRRIGTVIDDLLDRIF